MNLRDTLVVLRKEMVDLLRDRRSIIAMFVFPIVIHPVLIFGSARLSDYGEEKLDRESISAVLVGGNAPMREAIAGAAGVRIVSAIDPRRAVEEGKTDVALLLPEALEAGAPETPEVTVLFTASRELSRTAKDRVVEALEAYRETVRDQRLEALGAAHLRDVLPVEIRNVASEERMAGGKLGRMVPFLIVFLLLNGASFAAVDLFAGERERKTIETLLTSLADRGAVVAGKFAAVVLAAVTATFLFLLSSALFSKVGWIGGPGTGESLRVSLPTALVVLVVTFPLALFLSAVLVLVSSHARSYREAQTLLLPALLIAVVPAAFSIAPGVELESVVSVVPIANVAVAVREALVGNYPWLFLGVVVLSNALYAALVLRRATAYLASEAAVIGGGRRPPERMSAGADPVRVREVMAFYLFEVLLLYYAGSLVQSRSLIPGLLLTLWGFLLVPTLVFARAYGLDFRRHLSLRAPSARHALAGLLLAPLALVAAQLLFRVQGRFLPVPEEFLEGFERLGGGGEAGVGLLLFAVALSPGICEEVFFRGLILGQHRRVLSPLRAVLLGGFLFGLFHLSIYRLLPTALLGVAAGAVVIRSRSLFPAMLLHGAYNALTLLGARGEGWWERLQETGPLTVGVALALGASALALLRSRPPGRPDGA
ncbi:MAG: ABC transporter permease subunit/CPBP intramembrane protease [Candidatus Eisenbacteria bacterium]